MPVIITHIDHVGQPRLVRTKAAGWKKKYDVYPPALAMAYETFSPWHASLCERAAATGKRIVLQLRETKWGLEIVAAELEGQEAVQ